MKWLQITGLSVVWSSGGGAQFDGLAVGGVAVGVGPGFFAGQERRGIGETFCCEEVLESGEPVVVIMGAIVGFAAVGGGFEFGGEGGGPFLPGEMALLGKLYGEGEGLGLPRLGKDGTTVIAGKLRKIGKDLELANGIKLGQGSHPTYRDKRNLFAELARPRVRERQSARSRRAAAFRRGSGRWYPGKQRRHDLD